MIKNLKKSQSFEKKADAHVQKNQYRKAVENYLKALEYDNARLDLYDKAISSFDQFKEDWTEDDFAFSMDLTLRRQEASDPLFKRLHARHEPHNKEIHKLIGELLKAQSAEEETRHVEAIKNFGDNAVYPLIEHLLAFKMVGKLRNSKITPHAK
jgi:tetratricopeptide (TPR) repeat protein